MDRAEQGGPTSPTSTGRCSASPAARAPTSANCCGWRASGATRVLRDHRAFRRVVAAAPRWWPPRRPRRRRTARPGGARRPRRPGLRAARSESLPSRGPHRSDRRGPRAAGSRHARRGAIERHCRGTCPPPRSPGSGTASWGWSAPTPSSSTSAAAGRRSSPDRTVAYRARGIDHRSVHMAVVVQRQVGAQATGVLFTADPLTGNRHVAAVEAVLGWARPSWPAGQPDTYRRATA